MSKKSDLRKQRTGTVINATSKEQEKECIKALIQVAEKVEKKFGVQLEHNKTVYLSGIIEHLREHFPSVEFADVL